MWKPLLIISFACFFNFTNTSHAKNLHEACIRGIKNQEHALLGSRFFRDLQEELLGPQKLLMALVNNLEIYQSLEEEFSLKFETLAIVPDFFRAESLKKDISSIAKKFNLLIPTPTQRAKDLARSFKSLSPRGLKVAFFVFYYELLSPTKFQKTLESWLESHGLHKVLHFYEFSFACDEIFHNDIQNYLVHYFGKIQVDNRMFMVFTNMAEHFKRELAASYQSVYEFSPKL